MHDGAGTMGVEHFAHARAVEDVAMHEDVPRVVFQRNKIGGVARIGQLVQVDDCRAAIGNPAEHEIGADEAGAAGDKNQGLLRMQIVNFSP